jgi:propionate catabolism operon transcriptional regulator
MLDLVLEAAAPVLVTHDWPGNVRELENVAERVAMACLEARRPISAQQVTELLDIPAISSGGLGAEHGLSRIRKEQELACINEVIEQCGGNKKKAAERLGITRTTLWRKLSK